MKTTKQKVMNTLLMIIGMITLAGNLMATEFTEPVDHDVKSANGKFNLHVSVKDGIHEVSGEFGPKGGWKVQSKSSFQTFLISDDGESVAVVDWAMCKVDELDEPAVVIHGRGGVRGTFSYRELSVPRKLGEDEVGPIGDFWRVWRRDATLKGNLLMIDVEGRKPCVIDLQTAKLKALPDLGVESRDAPQGEEKRKDPEEPKLVFKCGNCGLIYNVCGDCGLGPRQHEGVNHLPQHEGDCIGIGEAVPAEE